MEKKKTLLRSLPKVDESMSKLSAEIAEKIPALLLKKIVRTCIENEREQILGDAENYTELSAEGWKTLFLDAIEKGMRNNLCRVINGTGVVIHTNLGRSLLPEEATNQLVQCAGQKLL